MGQVSGYFLKEKLDTQTMEPMRILQLGKKQIIEYKTVQKWF